MLAGMMTVRLDQCGVPLERRFTFYDHCHTTGMDIKQFYTARAALTLGKDMTIRDLAQGAYRMRGIGQGQTLVLLVIPEMATAIRDCLHAGAPAACFTSTNLLAFLVQQYKY